MKAFIKNMDMSDLWIQNLPNNDQRKHLRCFYFDISCGRVVLTAASLSTVSRAKWNPLEAGFGLAGLALAPTVLK